MFNNYSDNNITGFNFDELFEGKVLKVYDDNKCLVYIYKFFLHEEADSKPITGNYMATKDVVQSVNGIICKPMYNNSSRIRMTEGDDVLVLFLNGDPQSPFYFNSSLGKDLTVLKNDIVFKNSDVSIISETGENAKLIIRVKDNEFVFDDKFKAPAIGDGGIIIGGGSGTDNGSGGPIIEGTVVQDVNKFTPLQKYDLIREIKNIQDIYTHFEELSVTHKLTSEFIPYSDAYKALMEFMEPILENIDDVTEIDIEKYNEVFITYYMAYNLLHKQILLKKGIGGGTNIGPEIGPVEGDMIESVVKDLIYTTNIVATGQFIKEIIEDGIFSSKEKVKISRELTKIFEEKRILDTLAPAYKTDKNTVEVEYGLYLGFYNTLIEYLTPMMEKMDEDSEIDGNVFYNHFNDFFKKRTQLMDLILEDCIIKIDEYKKSVDSYTSDNKLTSDEKNSILNIYNNITPERLLLDALGLVYSVNSAILNNAYESFKDVLYNKRNGILNDTNELQLKNAKDTNTTIINYLKEHIKTFEKIIAVSKSYISTFMDANIIGSSNLLLNSSFLRGANSWEIVEHNKVMDIFNIYDDDIFDKYLHFNTKNLDGSLSMDAYKIRQNDDLMVTFWARSEVGARFTVQILDSEKNAVSIPYSTKLVSGTEFEKYIIPVKIVTDMNKTLGKNKRPKFRISMPNYKDDDLNYDCVTDITQIKLEFGNTPTEWTPAREDINFDLDDFKDKVAEYKSSITQTVDKIELSVEGFESTTQKITDKVNGFEYTMEEFREQSSKLTVLLDNIKLEVKDLYGKTEEIIQQIEDDGTITTTITQLQKRLSELILDVDGVKINVDNYDIKITEMEKELNGKADTSKVTEIESTIVDWETTVNQLGGSITDTKAKLTEIKTEIDEIKETTLLEFEQNILTMKGTMDGIENSISKTNALVGTIKEEVDGKMSNTEFVEFSKEYAGMVTTVNSIDLAVKKQEGSITTIQEVMPGFATKEEIIEYNDKFSGIDMQLDSITQKVGEVDVKSNKLTQDLEITNEEAQKALQTAVDAMDSSISESAKALLASKNYTQVEIETVNTSIDTAYSEIQSLKDSIKLTVTKEELDDSLTSIKIGGANFIRYSETLDFQDYIFLDPNNKKNVMNAVGPMNDPADVIKFTFAKGVTNRTFRFSHIVKTPGEYTFSMFVKSGGFEDGRIVGILNDESSNIDTFSGVWEFKMMTFNIENINSSMNHLDISFESPSSVYIYHPKFESGNRATDWTPNSSDTSDALDAIIVSTESSIKQATSELLQTTDSIKQSVVNIDKEMKSHSEQIGNRVTVDEFTSLSEKTASLEVGYKGIIGQVSDLETVTNNTINMVNEKADSTTVTNISEQVSHLNVTTTEIGMGVDNLQGEVTTLEKLTMKEMFTNFSVTGTMFNWDILLGNTTNEDATSLVVSDPEFKYNATIRSDESTVLRTNNYFALDSNKSYKFFINTNNKAATGTRESRFTIRFFDKDKNEIGSYLNNATSLSKDNYLNTNRNREGIWNKLNGYVFAFTTDMSDPDVIIKGNCKNALRMPQNAVYGQVSLEFVKLSPADKTLAEILYARPAVAEIDSLMAEQNKRLKAAEIKITDENIMLAVKDHSTYKNDMADRYTKSQSDAKLDITAKAITSRVTQTETDIKNNQQRISSAEQKITSDAIINTVNSKVGSGGALTSAIMRFDNSGLKCSFEDGTYAQMGRSGMRYYKSGMSKPYQYVTHVGKVSQQRNGYWTWMQLPEFFRHKAINSDFTLVGMLGDINCNAYVATGQYGGALRNSFIQIGTWDSANCRVQVRCCIQKISLSSHKFYGWDKDSTSSGAVVGESAADLIIIAQM